jgi:glutathione peroxidase
LATRPGRPTGFASPRSTAGEIDLDDWRGKPVLVVNTASLCGYAGQFDALQDLHEASATRP